MAFNLFNSAQLEIDNLLATVAEQAAQIAALKGKAAAINESLSDLYNDAFAVDFAAIDAFSIERDSGKTLIGYFLGGKVCEWEFQTNLPTHITLVHEFKTYRDSKQKMLIRES